MLPAAFVFCFGGKFVFGGRAFACTAGFFPRFGGSSVARPGGRDDASIVPYKSFGMFAAIGQGQHRTIPALRLKHRSGSCGTASALPKCSIMSGCGTRIVLRGQKPLALCDRCPCFGSLLPPLAALTFAASSIICAFGLASAAPRSPYRHLELCGIAQGFSAAG